MANEIKTIDITPTWRGMLPLLVEMAANGSTAKGRQEAMAELLRLADMMDQRIAEQKAAEAVSASVQAELDAEAEQERELMRERLYCCKDCDGY